MAKKKIVIIGAGPGGLTAAMLLANRGFDVQVFEKEPVVGGRNAAIRSDGFTFDVGPTFLMMRFILDEMFTDTGRNVEDYLDFVLIDPMYRLQFDDLEFTPTNNPQAMKQQIAEVFPGNEDGLDALLKREQKRFNALIPCLQQDYSSIFSLLSKDLIKALPQLGFRQSLFDVLGNYFKDEKLKLAFTFQAKYLGMSPWECPGGFTIIPFIEHSFGLYHVMGGLNQISEAMAKVVQEEGGSIHTSTPVQHLLLEGTKAKGVQLKNGEKVYADEVIINADFGHAVTNLIDQSVLKKYKKEKLNTMSFSCSTFMIYLGLDKLYDIPHHNIVFAKDYRTNVADIFEHKRLTDDMSIYIHNPTITDPNMAPEGKSALYILVPVANTFADLSWPEIQKEYRNKVMATIKNKTDLKDIEDHIEYEKILTPQSWENGFNVYKGATFNLGHNINQMLYFRPHNKFQELDNCYLVGGGTSPGSGLPTIYESARISSNLISEKYAVQYTIPSSVEHAKPLNL